MVREVDARAAGSCLDVERVPVGYDGTVKDPGEPPLAGLRVTNINLTPRLVAKLITQSYPTPFPNLNRANPPAGYRWLSNNPEHVFRDPDFLRFNPEFEVISIGSPRSGGSLIVEAARADASTGFSGSLAAGTGQRGMVTADQHRLRLHGHLVIGHPLSGDQRPWLEGARTPSAERLSGSPVRVVHVSATTTR